MMNVKIRIELYIGYDGSRDLEFDEKLKAVTGVENDGPLGTQSEAPNSDLFYDLTDVGEHHATRIADALAKWKRITAISLERRHTTFFK